MKSSYHLAKRQLDPQWTLVWLWLAATNVRWLRAIEAMNLESRMRRAFTSPCLNFLGLKMSRVCILCTLCNYPFLAPVCVSCIYFRLASNLPGRFCPRQPRSSHPDAQVPARRPKRRPKVRPRAKLPQSERPSERTERLGMAAPFTLLLFPTIFSMVCLTWCGAAFDPLTLERRGVPHVNGFGILGFAWKPVWNHGMQAAETKGKWNPLAMWKISCPSDCRDGMCREQSRPLC